MTKWERQSPFGIAMMCFPDDSLDLSPKDKSADSFWQFGGGYTWRYNPSKIALVIVLVLRNRCAKCISGEFPHKARGRVHFDNVFALLLSLCRAENSTCSPFHTVPSSVFEPAAVLGGLLGAELQGSACRVSAAATSAPTQSSCLEQMCWSMLGKSLRSEAFWEFRTGAERTQAGGERLPRLCSQLLFQTPSHVLLRRASSLCTCELFVLHSGLSLPFSSLSVTRRSGSDLRLRPYPWGLILTTGALTILPLELSSCRRCARSWMVQVPSEQPCRPDWLLELFDLLVRMLMSVLEDKGKGRELMNRSGQRVQILVFDSFDEPLS